MSSQHNSQPVFLSELIAGFSDLDVFFLLSALVSIIAPCPSISSQSSDFAHCSEC